MAKKRPSAKDLNNFDEYENSLNSITNVLGKQSDLYELVNKKLNSTKKAIGTISDLMSKNSDLTKNQADGIEDAANAYKDFQKTVAKSNLELKKGTITQSQYNDAIQDSYKSYESLVQSISNSGKTSKRVLKILEKMKDEMQSFNEAAKKSEESLQGMGSVLDSIGSSGIPAISQLSDLLKNIANKDAPGAKMAMTALGAAIGGLAANYFGAKQQVAIEAYFDEIQAGYDLAKEIRSADIEAGFIPRKTGLEVEKTRLENTNEINRLEKEAAFASQKAANEFNASMKMAAAEFSAMSKTALFGKGLGSVGYGAAQLQMAGISAETVASGMQAAANATGKMPTAKMGADMAIMAARTGQSADGIASINDTFMRLDGVSASTALNLQEGVRAMADKAGVNLGGVMEEMAGASKDILGFQIKSSSALAKQVIFAKSMGVSFNEVAKAGQSMVLNYKDSIKSEMQLSAMLGKNVDLSEVRAKFAAGDTIGATQALKAQGLDPAKMDMFQQQMLQQATGMDLSTLQKIATKTGTTGGELKAGAAGAGNQQFLSATTSAQAGLATQQANISANQAIIDAKLSQKITEAYLTSPGYLAYQKGLVELQKNQAKLNADVKTAIITDEEMQKIKAKEKQLAMQRTVGENALTAIGSGAGAYAGNKLAGQGLSKLTQSVAGKQATKSVASKAISGTAAKGLISKLGPITAAGLAGYEEWSSNKAKGVSTGENVARTATTAVGAGGGAWAGAATGAAVGAFAGPIGMAIGGLIGGAIGAYGGQSIAKEVNKAMFDNKDKVGETARKMAPANKSVTSNITASEKWMQNKMTYMSGNLERVVDRTTKTMINTAATTKELKTLNANTTALVNLTKQIEALTVATYTGAKTATSISIDGKKVANAYRRYTDNTRSTDPTTTTTPAPVSSKR